MPPEALEFVEILLHLVRTAPGSRFLHKVEDKFFKRECGLSFIEGGPGFRPVRRQSSEAEEVTMPGDPVAAARGIDVTDEPQQSHECEEGVARDPSGTKRSMKIKTGMDLKDSLRSGRQTELDVAVRGSDPDQRVQKRVRTHDVPAGPMFLNQLHLRKARVEIRFHTLDLDAGRCPYDPAHAAMLLSAHGVAILRETAFKVFRFADVNQFVLLIVNEVDAGRTGEGLEEFRAKLAVKISDGH
jgi:hypothetical protein